MDAILALILSCSLHYDDALVSAFVERVSDGNAYFVGDLATVTSYDHAKSLPEALAFVDEIEKRGGRPAVGLMAVPLSWASRYGRSTADLFDGCTNISIGTDAMDRFESECTAASLGEHERQKRDRRRGRSLTARRFCILHHFDLELGVRGYPEGVMAQLSKMSSRPAPTADRPPASSEVDVFHDPEWSEDRLSFYSPPAPAADIRSATVARTAGWGGPTPLPAPAPLRSRSY